MPGDVFQGGRGIGSVEGDVATYSVRYLRGFNKISKGSSLIVVMLSASHLNDPGLRVICV